MYLTIECPDVLFTDVALPGVMTGRGVQLEAVEEVPAGPWLAAVLDCIDPRSLSEWDLPAYLRGWARGEAWGGARRASGGGGAGGRAGAAGRLPGGVAELAPRRGVSGADKEVPLAPREPV